MPARTLQWTFTEDFQGFLQDFFKETLEGILQKAPKGTLNIIVDEYLLNEFLEKDRKCSNESLEKRLNQLC